MAILPDVEQLRSLFSYDPQTGSITSRHGRVVGSVDSEGYIRIRLKKGGRHFRAHRLAFVAMLGRWPEGDVDHLNGTRHDNRWLNLREVDRKTNSQNQRQATAQNSTSGMLGVSWDSRRRRWVAQIEVDGKGRNLGRFATAEEAHRAYIAAKRQLHAGCTI